MGYQWHALSIENIFQLLRSEIVGLFSNEVIARRQRDGENVLPREKPYSKLRLFLSQFNSPLFIILIAAGAISLYLAHYSDSIFIVVVLLINTSVGFYQENKANSSLQALRGLVKVSTRVRRDGNLKEVDSVELVTGDIVYLRAGDKVPADLRLIEQKGLRINESSLTGEWLASAKSVEKVDQSAPLAERANLAFMGTVVENGSATGVVVATGLATAMGHIVSLLRETRERKTPLQNKIASLSRWVSIFIIFIIALVVGLGYINNEPLADTFVASLALAVSAIPAGLLPAMTVILALGMRRILKQNGLVRKLIANETLGSVTVICTDKTGTLTEGQMQVGEIITGSNETTPNNLSALTLRAAVLANESFIENPDDEFHDWIVRGRPTERAFLLAGIHAGLAKNKLEKEYPTLDRVGFSSDAKYSASLHQQPDGGKILYVLGAPEIIETRSIDLLVGVKKEKLDSATHQKLLKKLESLTSDGLRVIACARREFAKTEITDNSIHEETMVKHLTILGYIALKDPLRSDASESIALTKRAGIRTVLITGDHRLTAQAIATEVGIEATAEMIMEGKELEALSNDELTKVVGKITIYARVSPEHKLRIVQALQHQGEVVAMVGDGVNDAPALKAADVGIVVDSGTDVAKEVADIVLLDNSFHTIVSAIEQGRIIFENIRKVFVYLVADDFSELFLFLVSMALGLPLPLLAAQILWINLVEDGLPDIALTTEQEAYGVMDDKPRRANEPILNRPLRRWMLAIFLITGFAAFGLFFGAWRLTENLNLARTLAFTLMCLDSLIFAFSVRSFKRPLWRSDIFSNSLLNGATLVGFALLLIALYLPLFQKLLATQALALTHWMPIITISLVEISLIEWAKKKFIPRENRPLLAS